jgi:hypothetical protein
VTGKTEEDLRALRKAHIGISSEDSVDLVRSCSSVELSEMHGKNLTKAIDLGWNILRSV